jgi:hypothetical protein
LVWARLLTGVIASIAAIPPVRFDGSFSKTAAGPTVTSDTRTATVPVASGGEIDFVNFVMTGSVQPQYSLNGGAWTNFGESDGVTVATGGTLALRITMAASGESLVLAIQDVKTGRMIESGITLAAS